MTMISALLAALLSCDQVAATVGSTGQLVGQLAGVAVQPKVETPLQLTPQRGGAVRQAWVSNKPSGEVGALANAGYC